MVLSYLPLSILMGHILPLRKDYTLKFFFRLTYILLIHHIFQWLVLYILNMLGNICILYFLLQKILRYVFDTIQLNIYIFFS